MLLEQLHDDLDSLFQLRVVSLTHRRRIKIHVVIRWNAVVLHFPFAIEAVNSITRRHYISAVDQLGISANADQSAPRPLANDETDI